MNECCPDQSEEFKKWILELVEHSFKWSVGQFEGNWYQQLVAGTNQLKRDMRRDVTPSQNK